MPWQPRGAPRKEVTTPKVRREPTLGRLVERIFVCCPLCAMSRKLDKSGHEAERQNKPLDTIKGRSHFGRFDIDDSFLIQRRDCSGSRGHGFPVIGGYTLKQAKTMPEYQEAVTELKDACRRILEALG